MLSIITNWVNRLPVGIPSKELKDILVNGSDFQNGDNKIIPKKANAADVKKPRG